jgi:hypothetical protein
MTNGVVGTKAVRKKTVRTVARTIGLLALVASRAVLAVNPTCFPVGGGGVPGQPGLPDWWTGAAPFDDPRWIGSYGFSQGTENFNALLDTTGGQKSLVLRWHVTGDAGGAVAGDQVWVGFYNPTTTVGTVLQLTRDALTNTTAGLIGAGVMSATVYTRTGTSGGWGATSIPTTIAAQARLDAFCDTTTLPVVCDEWIIRLRIPTTAAAGGLDLGDAFDMWYELDADHGGTATTDRAKFPVGAVDVDPTTLPLTFPEPLGSASPASAPWMNISTTGGTCAAGIDIQSSNITVANATDGVGTEIALTGVNTFHVKPTNNTTTVYSPNAIQARLRIADWGSSVGDSPQWDTVPDPTCAAATGPTTGTVGGGAQFDLTCTWTLTPGQQCDYGHATGCTPDAAGTKYQHQCIMAELSSTAVAVPFSTSSAWNNFNFDQASKLERPARIDVGSLGPRDVYVYIKTNNLPEKVEAAPPSSTTPAPGRTLSAASKERMGALAATLTPGRVTAKEAESLRGLVAAGRLSYEEVAQVMPTYTAYVWHDSGATVKTKGGPAKLLAPQPAFTLFVAHDGPLVGWKHAFAGLGGATVTEIAHNFYRVSVGSNGSVEVLTSVEAIERIGPPLWMILLGMLIFLILLWIIIRVVRG